jgi:hypothetical protein
MFDPRFKSLKVVENYVGRGACIHLVAEYDIIAIIPLLMIVFEVLNSIVQVCVEEVVQFVVGFGDSIKEDNNIFGVSAFMEESSCALVVGELSLLMRLYVTPTTCVDPLIWWRIHETQFPNVSFPIKQTLGIPGPQIDMECVFNPAGVLIALSCCRLQVDDLDQIINVVKNWPNNLCLNYL